MTTSTVHRPSTASMRPHRPPRPARIALSDLIALGPSVMPFGLALGVTTAALLPAGGLPLGLFGAAATYAGGSQLTATSLLAGGSSLWAAAATGIALNARLALYGAGLAGHFRGQPLWFRLLAPHFVIDASYLAASARPRFGTLREFRGYWWCFGLGLLAVWMTAVGSGMVLAPVLPELPHLSFVALAMFVELLVARLVSRPAVAAAIVSALTAGLASLWLPTLAVLLGAVAGVVAGQLAGRRR